MRVLIADDHALFRDSLSNLLKARGLDVVGEAANGREAVELSLRLRPSVVLMDLAMPEMDGLEATRRLAEEAPEVKVVILTADDSESTLFQALKAGAKGYLLKHMDSDRFFALLSGLERGEPALAPGMANKVLEEFARSGERDDNGDGSVHLTGREEEMLGLMVEGITSNRRLAQRMEVSENTVKFHIRNLLDKFHVHDRAQIVAHALRHHLVEARESEG